MNKSTEDRFASGFRGEKKSPADDNEENKPDVAVVIAAPGDSEGGPNATPAATAGGEGGEENPDAGLHGEMPMGGDMMGEDGGENLSPEDQQREASWKGRLKKMEDELKARAAELDSREAAMSSSPSPQSHNEAAEPASEEVDETPAMEAAEISDESTPGSSADVMANAPQEIKDIAARWSGDFGAEFMDDLSKYIKYVAEASAGAAVGPLKAEADDLRGTLQAVIDGFNTMHQGDLEDQEPEFEQVVNSPEFEQWVTSQEPDNQSRIVRALQGGSASRIVRILTQFKDSLKQNAEPAAGSVDTSALDAAAGVRSSGVSVPDTSAAGGSPEDAFARGFYGKTRK